MLTVISTFAGCGGSSLGYKWAGFKELLAIDNNANACQTFGLNFPGVKVWQRDIREVKGAEILDACGLKVGQLDVLDGSPPCQGFSTAGKRQVNDSRNDLSYEFARLIDELQPRAFVMENVSGLVKGKMRGAFKAITARLKQGGYRVNCRLLNAMYYGVPQSRERLIWIGLRADVKGEYEWPERSAVRTVREAFDGLKVDVTGLGLTSRYADYWRDAGQGGVVGKLQSVRRLRADRPAFTLQKSEGNGGAYHPTECRRLHLSEFRRLSSFPDGFKFTGSDRDAWSRIGNAVMPKMMQAIAGQLAKVLRA